jgi:hypothetical protein
MEILPIANIACSTIYIYFDLSKSTISGIPPLLTIYIHYLCIPAATLARAPIA